GPGTAPAVADGDRGVGLAAGLLEGDRLVRHLPGLDGQRRGGQVATCGQLLAEEPADPVLAGGTVVMHGNSSEGGDDVRSGASAADDGAGAVVDGVQIRGVARAGRQGAHGTGEGVLDPAGEDLAAGREDGTVAAVGVESVDLQRLHRGGRLRCGIRPVPGRPFAGDLRDRLADRLDGAVLV